MMRITFQGVLTVWCIVWKNAFSSFVIEDIGDCLDTEDRRLCDARNLTVGVLESGKWALLGEAVVNLEQIGMLTLEFTKCASKQEPETCMYFSTIRYKDGCKKLAASNEIWSSFFQNAEPPMKCPVQGSYRFEKSFIESGSGAQGLPGLEGYYWKVTLKIYQGKKTVCCFNLEVSTISG